MAKEKSAWDLETGLPTEFQGIVEDAYFTVDSEYNDGQDLLLKFEVQTDDDQIGDGGKTTLQFTCGKGWEAAEKGAKAVREDGKSKGFQEQSGVGLLVKHALGTDAGAILRARVSDNVGPRDAAIWKGLTFDWERKEFSGKIEGEDRTWYRMLPVKFIGENVRAGSTASEPVKAAPPTEASNGNGASAIDPAMRAKLLARAKASSSHDEFIEKCYSELDLAGNQAAEDAVMDANGIYAEANA